MTGLVGSQTPGVLEFDTSSRLGAVGETVEPPQPMPPTYPTNVIERPSIERFRANSDLELKLVTIRSVGMAMVSSVQPSVVMSSRKIGDVTPKLGSVFALFQTL